MNKNILTVLVAGLLILGGLFVFGAFDPKEENVSPTETPTPVVSTTSPQFSPSVTVTTSPVSGVIPSGVSTIRPECQLSGEIVFIADKLFRNDGAFFEYQKVMDEHDIVRWTVTPEGEDISVGPNRFSSAALPSGKDTITVGFNDGQPKQKSYTLKASIDYPYVVNNKVEILNKKCSGSTKVTIDY